MQDINLPDLLKNSLMLSEDLIRQNRITEAELVVGQIVKVVPDNPAALQLQGLIHLRNRKYKLGVKSIAQAIELEPENAENYNNIALCLLHDGQFEKALINVRKANELKPDNHNFVNNLGLILRASGKLDESIASFKKSLEINDKDARTWENLGSAYGQAKRLDDAIFCMETAMKLDPANSGCHVDMAYAYHLKGDWNKAWPEYEYRLEYWHKNGRNPGRFYEIYKPEKAWNGKDDISGKTVVVYCEQGVGDMIHFVRFVPRLVKLGANVVIDAPEHLGKLFQKFATIRHSHSTDICDYHCSILSLPYLLNIQPEEFWDGPYLDGESIMDMTDYVGQFKIGIVWAGNPGHPNDAARSCYLANFKELAQIPGVKLFSLQKEMGKRIYASSPGIEIDFMAGCEDMRLVDTSQIIYDFQDTANLIKEMDLVITVDTSVLHLAGAMNKETWAMIPYNPDWRWTISGEKTVWYPSVTLFRQTEPFDWKQVVTQITEKLKAKLNA